LGLEDEHFVVLAYGSLSRRKGLAQLMMMFGAHDLPKHYRLVLAGVQDAEATAIVGSFMARAGERRAQVLTLNKFCSEAEEATVFGAADLVWLCYENFSGMSGVLIQAAQAGVPVITSHVGLIDYVRGKRSLGLRWDDILMERSPELRFDWAKLESVSHAMKGSAKLAAFADEHSPGKFGRNVIDEIAVHGAVRR
jgi:glycosyltransferase involved in cell wall biosynthesis